MIGVNYHNNHAEMLSLITPPRSHAHVCAGDAMRCCRFHGQFNSLFFDLEEFELVG